MQVTYFNDAGWDRRSIRFTHQYLKVPGLSEEMNDRKLPKLRQVIPGYTRGGRPEEIISFRFADEEDSEPRIDFEFYPTFEKACALNLPGTVTNWGFPSTVEFQYACLCKFTP